MGAKNDAKNDAKVKASGVAEDDTSDGVMDEALLALARATKGFMPDDEGLALYRSALRAGRVGPAGGTIVEIGSWCGKSTIYLGAAAARTGAVVFSVDHHHGSEENQAGWEHHDPSVVDVRTGRIDTLPYWRAAVDGAGLGEWVVGVVGDSPAIAARWRTPVDLCFIDGGHGEEPAWADFRGWSPHVAVGGWLAIHDVFENPADGGRPPYELWRAAVDSREFVPDGACGSLRVLKRVALPAGAR
jgi:MMP 1-O-methyltransferase